MFALWKPAFVRAAGQAKLGFSGLDPLVSAQGVSSDCSTWDIWGISVFVLIDLSLHTLSQRQNNEDFLSLFVSNFITLQPGHSGLLRDHAHTDSLGTQGHVPSPDPMGYDHTGFPKDLSYIFPA